MESFIEAAFWVSLALLFYTYAGYPALLWVVRQVTGPLPTSSAEPLRWPTVTVVISAYNEEAVIERRIQNILDQDYPRDCVQILVGSDGSKDGTCERVARARFAHTQLCAFAVRRGKASVLNDLAATASGEFLIFTDAATMFHPGAIKQLVSGFWRYPTAAVISGKLEMRAPRSSRNVEGWYWRYESFLKRVESEIGAGLGASGTIYAVRRRDYCPLPPGTMADDLLEPLLIRMRTKGHVVLYEAARAWQLTPARVADEFRRRIRFGCGMAHGLRETWRLLLPQWGVVALALWSHKVLRLAGPCLLLTALTANSWLLGGGWFYQLLFAGQAAVYGLGAAAGRLRSIPLLGKAAAGARYFLVLNAALAVGCLKFMFGLASPAWNRTVRPAEPTVVQPAWSQSEPQEAVQTHRPAA